ncbi:hypothetical protein [Colwellia sp. MEBiC06753]
MENKKIVYFNNAIEFLSVEINNQEVEEFYYSCIEALATQERLEKPRLKELFHGRERTDKTYGNYLDNLVKLLDKYRVEIASRNEELAFNKTPQIVKHVGGGSGNATYYSIAFEEPNNKSCDLNEQNETTNIVLKGDITYRTKTLKRTPWYLKIASKFFPKTRHRQAFLLTILFYFIATPIALGFLMQVMPLVYWLILVFIYFVLFNPVWNIIKLATQKIALLEHIFQPIGAVCISKVTNVRDSENYLDVERDILSVVVDGTCPICFAKYQLKHSVQLEKQSLFKRRIVGKCLNNPQEHMFSFDKDLMMGTRLIIKN